MGRPERHDADYFPFYVKDGKTLFILESKYGLQGIGFFTNVMRFLTKQPDHHICIRDESDRLYFFAQIRCPEESGMDMLNLMSKTGKIDHELWDKKKVIVSQDLLDSLQEAYKNRNNPIIEIGQIRLSYPDNEVSYQENPVTSPDNPQRKGKERKGKETNSKVIPDWVPKNTFLEYLEMRNKIKKPLLEKSFPRFFVSLKRLCDESRASPEQILNQSIINSWQGIFPLKTGANTNAGIRTIRSDPRDRTLQSREDAEIAAITAKWEAAKAASSSNAGGDAGNDDAPDFSS